MGGAERPIILVLAGVNGAGKSSVGGAVLIEHGLNWFNPDSVTRKLVEQGVSLSEANSRAWSEGVRHLEAAIALGTDFAFETTLGGSTIRDLLKKAAATHDLVMFYCGLASVELHIERVAIRVAHGGHDIPEAKIRERWNTSRKNLTEMMPYLQRLQVFDNSIGVATGEEIPEPRLILEIVEGRVFVPDPGDPYACESTPDWAREIVQAALTINSTRDQSAGFAG